MWINAGLPHIQDTGRSSGPDMALGYAIGMRSHCGENPRFLSPGLSTRKGSLSPIYILGSHNMACHIWGCEIKEVSISFPTSPQAEALIHKNPRVIHKALAFLQGMGAFPAP